jgi:cell division protein FtsQ
MARAAALSPLPVDVRLTMAGANAVIAVMAIVLAAAALLWLTRLPVFAVRGIVLEGDLTHNTAATVRAHAAPKLAGGLFTLDLERAQAAFESVPWVRRATVRRVWPDRLAVRLEEHVAAAHWITSDGADRLVNTHGEVFEANVGDVEDDNLPRLAGPRGSAARVLAMHRALAVALAPLDGAVATLRLSARGSWRVELDGGVAIELGRGDADEVVARAARFARTLPQVMQTYQRPLLHADLRHPDGYAVRLKGIATFANAGRN